MGSMFSKENTDAPVTVAKTPEFTEKTKMSQDTTPVKDQGALDWVVQARTDDITQAWLTKDAGRLGSWFSEDLTFSSPNSGVYNKTKKHVVDGYYEQLADIAKTEVLETQTNGTPFLTVKENLVKLTKADTSYYIFRESVICWWKYEGVGAWDDVRKDDDNYIRGWKIYEQHDYETEGLDADSEGATIRIFPTKKKT